MPALIDVSWDGAAPLDLTLRDAGHPAGLYMPYVVVTVTDEAVAGVAHAMLGWSDDDFECTLEPSLLDLTTPGQRRFDFPVVYSDGVAPVVLGVQALGLSGGVFARVRAHLTRVA